jgi:effector-binding domain-containing protein
MKEMKTFFSDAFPSSAGAVSVAGLNMAGMPTALYYEWNEELGMVDLFAGMPIVGDSSTTVDGFQTAVVPAGRALNLSYRGSYDGLGEAHGALDDKMKEDGLEFNVVAIEEYITDPGAEPDTSKWITEIYYMIK